MGPRHLCGEMAPHAKHVYQLARGPRRPPAKTGNYTSRLPD